MEELEPTVGVVTSKITEAADLSRESDGTIRGGVVTGQSKEMSKLGEAVTDDPDCAMAKGVG